MLLSTGEREAMTLLAIAIHALGRRAISLTGSQCGIITDHQHGRARIIEVRPFRILDELAAGHIVIVGGFQGVSYKREVTTLGRGGSDSSAVALAAALSADCEIYSDVDGVYSADPGEVPEARRLPEIAYDTMQALARAGAKVLHAQAVQLAEERGIAIYARHSGPSSPARPSSASNPAPATGVLAVASDAVAALALLLVPGHDHLTPTLPQRLAAGLAPLGLFALHVDERRRHRLAVVDATHRRRRDPRTRRRPRSLSCAPHLLELRCDDGLALVSCIGVGLEDRPDITTQACEVLRAAGVVVRQLITDARSLAFVVASGQRLLAVRQLHADLVPAREAGRPGVLSRAAFHL
jgi:aspartate kinase